MNDKVQNKLSEELLDQLDSLNKMELGTDKYKVTVDGVTKLGNVLVDLKRIEAETNEKEAGRNDEYELKLKQIEEAKKDRHVKIADMTLKAVLVSGLSYAAYRFEKGGGIFTSSVGRGIIRNIIPKF